MSIKSILEKYLTDAVLVSVFIVFCYCIQIATQLGEFTSFGLPNPIDIADLNLQGTIVSFVNAIVAACIAFLLFRWTIRSRIRISSMTENKWKRRVLKLLNSLALSAIYTIPLFITAYVTLRNRTLVIIVCSAILWILVAIYFSIATSSKNRGLMMDLDTLINKIKKPRNQRAIVYLSLFITLTLFYSFLIGYTSPRLQDKYPQTNLSGQTYLIIHQTPQRLVLGKLQDGSLLPEYKYINLSDSDVVNVEVHENTINFDQVGPFSRLR